MKQFFTSKLFIILRRFGRIIGINKYIRFFLDVGDYQESFDKILISSMRKQDIFWDIGSNHGEIVKKAKCFLDNDIYVIAFEPHPCLSANLKKLKYKNYEVIDAALSSKVGMADFFLGSDPDQTTGKLDIEKINTKTIQVRVIDIKYALKKLNLKNPNIMKIDVEGHEYEVLKSILSNIDQLKNLRSIFVEIHMSILDKRKLSFKMEKLLEKFQTETNFKFFWIDVSHFKMER